MKNDYMGEPANLIQELKTLSSSDFLNIGMHDIAYIRRVTEDGKARFAIHAANGMPLGVVDTQKDAWLAIFENNLEAVTLH